MPIVVTGLVTVLFANAVVAFCIAFYWQAKVIRTIYGVSDWKNTGTPWAALADQNSLQNRFGHFFAGQIFPELRQKWVRAIAYVVFSYAILFLVAGMLKLFRPDLIL